MKNDNKIKQQTSGGKKEGSVLALTFTRRESECMEHVLQGKSIQQISDDLEISPKTIFYYLNSIQIKIIQLNRLVITDPLILQDQ
jgi:DNA-binding CsgD family transcriptional regulator